MSLIISTMCSFKQDERKNVREVIPKLRCAKAEFCWKTGVLSV